MSLWKLRWTLFARWVRMIGPGLVVVLVAAAAATLLFLVAAVHEPWVAVALGALIPLRLHSVRRDLRLLGQLCPHPRLQLGSEYLVVSLPCIVLLALYGLWAEAGVLAAVAALTPLLPQPRRRSYAGRRLRIGWLGFSPEWTAGLRRHPLAAAIICAGVLVCCTLPYLGFPALYVAALLCQVFYTRNEPLSLLLPELPAGRFLACKIRTACRNYFLAAAVPALLAVICHPGTAWLAAVWAPMSALMMVYFVVTKYAFYDPSASETATTTAGQFALAGFLLPPLLPVTLVQIVNYALRAEKKLNRYLYDYD